MASESHDGGVGRLTRGLQAPVPPNARRPELCATLSMRPRSPRPRSLRSLFRVMPPQPKAFPDVPAIHPPAGRSGGDLGQLVVAHQPCMYCRQASRSGYCSALTASPLLRAFVLNLSRLSGPLRLRSRSVETQKLAFPGPPTPLLLAFTATAMLLDHPVSTHTAPPPSDCLVDVAVIRISAEWVPAVPVPDQCVQVDMASGGESGPLASSFPAFHHHSVPASLRRGISRSVQHRLSRSLARSSPSGCPIDVIEKFVMSKSTTSLCLPSIPLRGSHRIRCASPGRIHSCVR